MKSIFQPTLLLLTFGCSPAEEAPAQDETPAVEEAVDEHPQEEHADDHTHDEVSLGSVSIGDLVVELAQGHGPVVAGEEGHLVVKLPYNDGGATIVRAWIGISDPLFSYVGKGTYAPSHDDYDVHATAPTPLPENVQWWITIEKPDGTKLTGSVTPIL